MAGKASVDKICWLGGAALGNGWVGLILDVDTVAQMPYHPPRLLSRSPLPCHEPSAHQLGLILLPGKNAI